MSIPVKCVNYFCDKPGWERQLATIRAKYCSFGAIKGQVTLNPATQEELTAAGLLFGRIFTGPCLQYKLADFCNALEQSSFGNIDLHELLEAYYQTKIIVKSAAAAAKKLSFETLLSDAQQIAETPQSKLWLCEFESTKYSGRKILVRNSETDPISTGKMLSLAVRGLDALVLDDGKLEQRLAVFSAKISANPHEFDFNALAGKLLLYGICFWKKVDFPKLAEQRAECLFAAGLLIDDISSFTAQQGLQLFAGSEEHPATKAFRERNEACLLMMSNLLELSHADSAFKTVFVVENQMVFSHLCAHVQDSACPLVCTSGQLKIASLKLLDLLVKSDCKLYYSGDFDPEGLQIADRLVKRYPKNLTLWHFDEQDYHLSISDEDISESRLTMLAGIADPLLQATAKAIAQHKKAGYQELILEKLLEDIVCSSR